MRYADQHGLGLAVSALENQWDRWVAHDAVESDPPLSESRLHVLGVLKSDLDEQRVGQQDDPRSLVAEQRSEHQKPLETQFDGADPVHASLVEVTHKVGDQANEFAVLGVKAQHFREQNALAVDQHME